MIPGPVEVDSEVLATMAKPMVAHYGTEWTAFYEETLDLLLSIFRTKGHVVLLVGSGSAALDAAFNSICYPGEQILVLRNGFFGERLEEIARAYTPHVHAMEFPLSQPVELEAVREALSKRSFRAVAVVHCETSTGLLNPICELAKLSHEHGAIILLDAISSLAIEPIDMDTWEIDVCISASQKGLEAPPGLSIVAVRSEVWETIERGRSCGWYLNLGVWKDYENRWGDWHPHPVTHAVSNVHALRVALERILEEGLEQRFLRHRAVTARLRAGLRELGFRLFVPEEVAAHGVTAVEAPEGNAKELRAYVREHRNLLLAGSVGGHDDLLFRIGHMGPGATPEAVDAVLLALREAITSTRRKERTDYGKGA